MIRLYPVLWAAVTLSSVLAMPAFSAAKSSIPLPIARPGSTPAAAKSSVPLPVARPAAASSAEPVAKTKAKATSADAPAPKRNNSIKNRPFIVQSCRNKVHGTYVFGRAPYGCDADQYEDITKLQNSVNGLVFNEKKEQKAEVTRYTTSMYRFIRDAADAYITRRNPNVSKAEKDTFRRAIMALVHQESFWSHYRISSKDNRVKVMKGDHDFSFGMMQIHGRWHRDMLMKYEGWTVQGNLAYGMDTYYQAWQKVKSARCVRSLSQRARAAYSVYNGGGYATCRWTNPGDKWARNDKGFNEKFTGQLWNKLIDKSKVAELPSEVQMATILDESGEPDAGTRNL